jgi:hypothetical protein
MELWSFGRLMEKKIKNYEAGNGHKFAERSGSRAAGERKTFRTAYVFQESDMIPEKLSLHRGGKWRSLHRSAMALLCQ